MKRLIGLFVFLLMGYGSAYAQTAAITQFCWRGGIPAVTSGLNSTNYLQGTIPSCTVTVYLTGTLTKATIYADGSNTPLANPFTANALGSAAPGQWLFYASTSNQYDVVLSGGIPPNTYPAPVTLVGLGSGGGGGGGGSCGTVTGDNTSTNCGYQNRVGDTASIPANVSTFGTLNGAVNVATEAVAVGTGNLANNTSGTSSQLVGIGYQNINASGAYHGVGTLTDVVALGDDNVATDSLSLADLVCLGHLNCGVANGASTTDSLREIVGIGDDSASGLGANSHDDIGIGDESGSNDTGTDIVGVGDASATNALGQDFAGLGNGAATNIGAGSDNIVGVGDGAASSIGAGSSDIVGVGDGAAAAAAAGVVDVVGVGNGSAGNLTAASSDVVGVGDGAAGLPFGSTSVVTDIVGMGDGAAGSQGGVTGDAVSEIIGLGTRAAICNAGNDVIAVGPYTAGAGYHVTNCTPGGNSGVEIVAIGDHALVGNTTGFDNVAIGGYAGGNGYTNPSTIGNSNTTGSENTWIGYGAGPASASQLSNTLALGYNSTPTASNQAVLGNGSMTDTELYGVTHVNGASGVAGGIGFLQGTAPAIIANNVEEYAPTSVTGYRFAWPGAADSGLPLWANSLNTVTESILTEVDGDCVVGVSGAWAAGACASGGTNVTVNGGSDLVTANFSDTTPTATSGYQNVKWQTSTTNVSAEVPLASASLFGVAKVDNTTITASAGVISAVNAGDTITSPNSTINVGGTHTATQLDLAGAAGEIMAGTTPALTYTPEFGVDNSHAGTLSLANGSANAHTVWGSAATTTNTILGFATAPTTGDLVDCVVSSTTCTLTDAGVLAANLTTNSSNFGSAGILYATGNHTTAASTNATLNSSGDMAVAQLVAIGIVDGTAPVHIETGNFTFGNSTYLHEYHKCNNGSTGCIGTLPTAAAGLQYCLRATAGTTGVLTFQTSASGQYLDVAGTNTASGGYVVSGGAAGDSGCAVGIDATHWDFYPSSPSGGTWVGH